MGRGFVYVILGGGVAAGYAALEFTRRGVNPWELCIISQESVVPYERPELSKGFLLPKEAEPARLPSFHTCVGANEERLTSKWYKKHGIEVVLETEVKSVDVKWKLLVTATGETIRYGFLIIATGSRAMKLEDIKLTGSRAGNVCYLRDFADANRLVDVMRSCVGGNAVVIGGDYIGMECAAALVSNKLNVTMVFPDAHIMAHLFTPKIASYYEDHYKSKGVKFIKGTGMSSFDMNAAGEVTAVNLKNGSRLPADMVVVGIGARPNTALFEGQLTFEKGGIKVNGQMQTSDASVYAVGDVATFPVKLWGETRRLEHVDLARKSARHAVATIMDPYKTTEFDYLPFFYSRAFSLSWEFYGDNAGEVVHFGNFSGNSTTFGAYWINRGHLVGSFLEGGSEEHNEAIAKVTRLRPAIEDLVDLQKRGLDYALLATGTKSQVSTSTTDQTKARAPTVVTEELLPTDQMEESRKVLQPPPLNEDAAAGVVVAVCAAVFAFGYLFGAEGPLYTAGVILAVAAAAFVYWYGPGALFAGRKKDY